jgi:hypothetical protein
MAAPRTAALSLSPEEYAARLAALSERDAAIAARLRAGETQASVAALYSLNPVTVGRIAHRAGLVYPQAVANAEARRGKAQNHPERDFRDELVKLFKLLGWRHYFTQRSEHSPAGFPDLVLTRPPRVIVAELKAENGRMTPAQKDWRADFEASPGVEYYLWKPSDWDALTAVLQGEAA